MESSTAMHVHLENRRHICAHLCLYHCPFYYFLAKNVYIHLFSGGSIWMSEDNLWDSVLSFHYVSPGTDCKHLYLPNQLIKPPPNTSRQGLLLNMELTTSASLAGQCASHFNDPPISALNTRFIGMYGHAHELCGC